MSKPNSYSPNPIPVEHVPDTPRLRKLIEQLAANAHDVWAQKRMEEGWTYGEAKDAPQKKSPFLVSYEELPESEKETDRAMVRTALKAAMSQGWRIEPPPRHAAETPSALSQTTTGTDSARWIKHLERELGHACTKAHARAWTFDMDDLPEIASGLLVKMPAFSAALDFLQETVHPAWHEADEQALKLQRKHRGVARWAISAGTLAIALAILQLVLGSVGLHLAAGWVAIAEIAAVIMGAMAVVRGLSKHYHDSWLTKRQSAERLRILKFQALSWPQLWCDMEEWSRLARVETDRLASLTSREARRWAMELDTVIPEFPAPPDCTVNPDEAVALAAFYRAKRPQFQKHYFETQALKADRQAWGVRWRLPLIIFVLSVAVVFVHATVAVIERLAGHGEHSGGHSLAPLEVWLVGLAALLPVVGFGMRAWLSAFEVPRSRNLFRAKARALEQPIQWLDRDAGDIDKTIHHITRDEHFFANEHREWCRLQMEAEWFL